MKIKPTALAMLLLVIAIAIKTFAAERKKFTTCYAVVSESSTYYIVISITGLVYGVDYECTEELNSKCIVCSDTPPDANNRIPKTAVVFSSEGKFVALGK